MKAATPDKLIQRFTSSKYEGTAPHTIEFYASHARPGRNPINAFLLSYRLFITPVELMGKLAHRYSTKAHGDPDDLHVVQLRVLAFLKVRPVTRSHNVPAPLDSTALRR